jgi:hypothetical protein
MGNRGGNRGREVGRSVRDKKAIGLGLPRAWRNGRRYGLKIR